MITIKEIAGQLGMSTATVSNVIHGKTGEVSPATIERVQKYLEEVNYVPNINARNLAQQKTRIVGVVLKAQSYKHISILEDPFVSTVLSGIEKTLREAGYYMMIYISDDISEILRKVASWNVDGLLLFYMLDDDAARVSARFNKPVVCIDAYYREDIADFYVVGMDDENASYNAASYLIRCGHRDIGFLADNLDVTGVDYQRFRGYRRALRESGIEYCDRNFCHLRPGKEEITQSLNEICGKAEEVTAILCSSDLYAAMLISFLIDHGRRVPEDVSVIGFDDNLFAKWCRPAITTIHQDNEEKGRMAARTLISIFEGNPPAERRIEMKTELIVRDTVKIIGNTQETGRQTR